MRVLLLNYEYPPFGGGAAVATEALARGLARRGTMVEVITADAKAQCLPVNLASSRTPAHATSAARKPCAAPG